MGQILITIVLVLIMPVICTASTFTGILDSSQTWTVAGGPYMVDELTIPVGVTLTVEPGAQIVPVLPWIDEPKHVFRVSGSLIIGSVSGPKSILVINNPPVPVCTEYSTRRERIMCALREVRREIVVQPPYTLFRVDPTGRLMIQNTEISDIDTLIENRAGIVEIDGLKAGKYKLALIQFNQYTSRLFTPSTIISNSDLLGSSLREIQVQGGMLNINTSNLVSTSSSETPYSISAGTQVDLSNNWWGVASGPDASMFTGQTAIYSPWLTTNPFLVPTATTSTITPAASLCVTDCNSNIVFIPGLMGSRLYERKPDTPFCIEEGNSGYCVDKKWLPFTDSDIRDIYLNVDGSSINPNIVTKDVVDSALGIKPLYKSLIDDMASWQQTGLVQNATSTPYDWRLSIDDIVNKGTKVGDGYISFTQSVASGTTPYILDTILQSASSSSRTSKVTLVAHSNGGLVAKAIMQKLRDLGREDIVDNLILIAVPQIGTPDAGASLLHGSCIGQIKYEENIFACVTSDPAETRSIAKNMPSAYHLLPSNEFFNTQFVQDKAPLAFDGSKTLQEQTLYGSEVRDITNYQNYLKGTDGRSEPAFSDTDSPAIVNEYLLNQANQTHTSLDAWRPASTTKVIEVAGWGKYTTASLKYQTVKECKIFILRSCALYTDQKTIQDIKTINGDETVVSPSALHLSTKTGGIDRWWLNLETEKTSTHKDILEVSELRSLIKNTITNSTSTAFSYLTKSETPPASNVEYYSVRVHSPLNIHLYDTLGNHTGLNASGTLETNIPGSQYFQIGEVKSIIAPKVNLQKVELDAYASGSFTIDQEVMVGDTILASSSIQAIPTATSTKVSIILSNTNITQNTISVDLDADTVVDITATPVSGTSTVYYAPQAIDTPVPPIAVQLSQVSYSQGGGSGGSLYTTPPLLKTEALTQLEISTSTQKIIIPKEKVLTKREITKKNKPVIKKKVIKQTPVTKLKPITKTLEPLAGTPKPPETLQVKPLTLKQRIINYFKLQ